MLTLLIPHFPQPLNIVACAPLRPVALVRTVNPFPNSSALCQMTRRWALHLASLSLPPPFFPLTPCLSLLNPSPFLTLWSLPPPYPSLSLSPLPIFLLSLSRTPFPPVTFIYTPSLPLLCSFFTCSPWLVRACAGARACVAARIRNGAAPVSTCVSPLSSGAEIHFILGDALALCMIDECCHVHPSTLPAFQLHTHKNTDTNSLTLNTHTQWLRRQSASCSLPASWVILGVVHRACFRCWQLGALRASASGGSRSGRPSRPFRQLCKILCSRQLRRTPVFSSSVQDLLLPCNINKISQHRQVCVISRSRNGSAQDVPVRSKVHKSGARFSSFSVGAFRTALSLSRVIHVHRKRPFFKWYGFI
eukprot:6211297-Pleurochrysis_carterae.AAC.2